MSAPLDMRPAESRLGHNGGPPLDGISEAAPEKKKRGRPPRFAALGPLGNRSEMDRIYLGSGLAALAPEGDGPDDLRTRLGWLYGKRSLVSQFGRLSWHIDDGEAIRALAAEMCEKKPAIKDAIAGLRRWRLGREAPASGYSLLHALGRCLDQYRAAHPSLNSSETLGAINALYSIVSDLDEKARAGSDGANGRP